MPETRIKGINIGDATVTEADISLASASVIATPLAAHSFVMWDTANAVLKTSPLANVEDYFDTKYSLLGHAHTLNQILSPTANTTWSMGGNTLTYNFTNPVGGVIYNMTGGWSGHVFEIMDSSVAPSAAGDHLLHIETSRQNVVAAHFINNHASGHALHVEGKSMMGVIEATSFIKTSGTSAQFLKADGSVDSNTYLTGTKVDSFNTRTGNVTLTKADVEEVLTGVITSHSHASTGGYTGWYANNTEDSTGEILIGSGKRLIIQPLVNDAATYGIDVGFGAPSGGGGAKFELRHRIGSSWNHIPTGGATGEILGWAADGEAQWVTGGGGSGTVTSVGLALPTDTFAISNSPVTTSGVLTAAYNVQGTHSFFAGPRTAQTAVPTWRTIHESDLPALPYDNYSRWKIRTFDVIDGPEVQMVSALVTPSTNQYNGLRLKAGTDISINAASGDSGYLDVTINFTGSIGGVTNGDKGDITVSSAGDTWTIDSGAVSYSKMQPVSVQNRILGRANGAGVTVAEMTPAQVRTTITSDITSSGVSFLNTSGTSTKPVEYSVTSIDRNYTSNLAGGTTITDLGLNFTSGYTYEIEVNIIASMNNTGGAGFGFSSGNAGLMQGSIIGSTTSTITKTAQLVKDTLINGFLTTTNALCVIFMKFYVVATSNTGMAILGRVVTSGQTLTIKAGSYIKSTRLV